MNDNVMLHQVSSQGKSLLRTADKCRTRWTPSRLIKHHCAGTQSTP